MSRAADPVIDAAAADSADGRPEWPTDRRPRLAEAAHWTAGLRRMISRFGVAVPVSLALATIAVSSAIDQSLRGGVEPAELGLWLLGTLLLLTPLAAASVVMLGARRGGLVWTTGLVYSAIAGVIGLCVDANVLGTDLSSASGSLISALIVQVGVLAPVCAAAAFVIRIVCESTRLAATGKNFDKR